MRWRKYLPLSRERTVTRFLLFPRDIQDEVRWLEFARIRQRCSLDCASGYVGGRWTDLAWASP